MTTPHGPHRVGENMLPLSLHRTISLCAFLFIRVQICLAVCFWSAVQASLLLSLRYEFGCGQIVRFSRLTCCVLHSSSVLRAQTSVFACAVCLLHHEPCQRLSRHMLAHLSGQLTVHLPAKPNHVIVTINALKQGNESGRLPMTCRCILASRRKATMRRWALSWLSSTGNSRFGSAS